MKKRGIGMVSGILGGVVIVAALYMWAMGGFHMGWTQTQIPYQRHDPVTGIDYPVYEEGFVAGLEFLGAGLLVGLVLLGIGFYLAGKHSND